MRLSLSRGLATGLAWWNLGWGPSSLMRTRTCGNNARGGGVFDDTAAQQQEEDELFSQLVLPNSVVFKDPLSPHPHRYVVNNSAIEEHGITPLLLFINHKSGGRRGKALLESIKSLPLHPLQVVDLSVDSPGDMLSLFANCTRNLQVLTCGGDGSVNWILDELSARNMTCGSFGLVPLGTGNDLYVQMFRTQQWRQKQELLLLASSTSSSPSSSPSLVAPPPPSARQQNPKSPLMPRVYAAAVDTSSALVQQLQPAAEAKPLHRYPASPEALIQNPKHVLAQHSLNLQSSRGNADMALDRWSAVISPSVVLTSSELESSEALGSENAFVVLRKKLRNLAKKMASRLGLRNKREIKKTFSNYVGLGVDGAVSLSFASLRSYAPWLFVSSIVNKFWYALCGVAQILFGYKRDLSKSVALTCDGKSVLLPPGIRGIVVLNINSYAGGSRLWRADDFLQQGPGGGWGGMFYWAPSKMDDGVIEVMGVYGVRHLGLIKSGLSNAVPICQGKKISITCANTIPLQIDGEPSMQSPCTINFEKLEQVNVTIPLFTQ